MNVDQQSTRTLISGHLILTAVALVGCGIFFLCGTGGGKTTDEAGTIAAGIAGCVALGHLLLALCHPRALRLRHGLALSLAAVTPCAFWLPVAAQPENGWPVNPGLGPRANGRVHSRVVAPGDTVSMSWTEDDLKTVAGRWSGTPKVKVLNARELGCPGELVATGKNDTWNSIIWTEASFKSLPPFLTAEFRIPDDESLAGKSLKLQTTLEFEFPTPQGRNEFVDARNVVNRFDDVLLTSAAVKQSYWSSWSRGASMGMTSTLLAGLLLALFALGTRTSTPSLPASGGGSPWRVSLCDGVSSN